MFMVLAATDDPAVNARLCEAGRAAGALVSRVDAPAESDFTVPAWARGEWSLATISTDGLAPSASRRLGRELGRWLAEGPDRFVAEIARVRQALSGRSDGAAILRKLGESELLDACRARDDERIASIVRRALGEAS
jgi:precorrin-2 dehydrogenase/sirohydrochlorin ferrochelatase